MEILRRTPDSSMRRVTRRLGLLPVAVTAISAVPIVVSIPTAEASAAMHASKTAPKQPTTQDLKTANRALGYGIERFRANITSGSSVTVDMGSCFAWPTTDGRQEVVTANPGINGVSYGKNKATAYVGGYDSTSAATTPPTITPEDGAFVLRLHEGSRTLQYSTAGAFGLKLVSGSKDENVVVSQQPSLIPGTDQWSDTEVGSGQPVMDTAIEHRIPTGNSQAAQARESGMLSADCLQIDPYFDKNVPNGPAT
jgi:hypothetical protein